MMKWMKLPNTEHVWGIYSLVFSGWQLHLTFIDRKTQVLFSRRVCSCRLQDVTFINQIQQIQTRCFHVFHTASSKEKCAALSSAYSTDSSSIIWFKEWWHLLFRVPGQNPILEDNPERTPAKKSGALMEAKSGLFNNIYCVFFFFLNALWGQLEIWPEHRLSICLSSSVTRGSPLRGVLRTSWHGESYPESDREKNLRKQRKDVSHCRTQGWTLTRWTLPSRTCFITASVAKSNTVWPTRDNGKTWESIK